MPEAPIFLDLNIVTKLVRYISVARGADINVTAEYIQASSNETYYGELYWPRFGEGLIAAPGVSINNSCTIYKETSSGLEMSYQARLHIHHIIEDLMFTTFNVSVPGRPERVLLFRFIPKEPQCGPYGARSTAMCLIVKIKNYYIYEHFILVVIIVLVVLLQVIWMYQRVTQTPTYEERHLETRHLVVMENAT